MLHMHDSLTICGGQGERPHHLAPCLDEGYAQEGGQLVHTVQLQPVRRQAAGRHRATPRGAAEEGHGRLWQEGAVITVVGDQRQLGQSRWQQLVVT